MKKEEKRMMITAHSGCEGTEDNSLDFLQYALQLPVDALEVDVRKNSRGELILSHDETQEEAVGLDQAFTLLKEYPGKRINCDMKQPDLEKAVVELAEKFGVEKQLIFTGAVNPELFRKGDVLYPEVLWFANPECILKDDNDSKTEEDEIARLERVLQKMLDYEAQGLNCSYGDAEKVWQKAKTLGVGLSVWTVNDPKQQEIWLSRQVENITTRRPVQLIKIRDGISLN